MDEHLSDEEDEILRDRSALASMMNAAGMGMGMGMGGLGRGVFGGFTPSASHFRRNYNSYSMAILEIQQGRSGYAGRENAMYGGKIVMPASALQTLTDLELPGPWTFEIVNSANQSLRTHCGVLEFIADEGQVHLPQWMMSRLSITEGDPITIQGARLPKGKLVKLQAQSTLFLELSDPKAVLEQALRNFSCLTVGDIIEISYNSMQFELLVMETQPAGEGINVIDTDLEVDFAAPKGYVEPKPVPKAPAPTMASKFNIRTDSTQEVDSRGSGTSTPSSLYQNNASGSNGAGGSTTRKVSDVFMGAGKSLSGKRVKGKAGSASRRIEDVAAGSVIYRTRMPRVVTNNTQLEERRVPVALNLPFGHLFFGYPVKKPSISNSKEDAESEEENKNKENVGKAKTVFSSGSGTTLGSRATPRTTNDMDGQGNDTIRLDEDEDDDYEDDLSDGIVID